MSDVPLNPAEAAKVLWQIGGEIDAAAKYMTGLRRARPELERAYRMAYARSFLSLDGSVEVRRQKAITAADEARFQLDVNDQEIETCKERLRSLRDQSEIARAVNSNLKEELRVLGGTDRP